MTSSVANNQTAIYTDNPENEIWDYISDFESVHFVRHYIEKRLEYLQNILKNKQRDLIVVNDIERISLEVNNTAKQARDFFMQAKELSLLSKPIMLHYAFEKLANILISVTYRKPQSRYPYGLFPLFHDCYSTDRSIHVKGYQFSLENLIDSGNINYMKLCYNMRKNKANISVIDSKLNENVIITELDREFMFIFALSTLARYRVNEWDEIISGKRSNLIAKVRRYLGSLQLLFPNLILNELYMGKILSFYAPAMLASIEIDEYDTPFNLFDE
jgi:hypothetical protein